MILVGLYWNLGVFNTWMKVISWWDERRYQCNIDDWIRASDHMAPGKGSSNLAIWFRCKLRKGIRARDGMTSSFDNTSGRAADWCPGPYNRLGIYSRNITVIYKGLLMVKPRRSAPAACIDGQTLGKPPACITNDMIKLDYESWNR